MACPKLLGSRQASCGLSVACPKPGASEGNVRHFGSARPLCGLSEACLLSSYGLPKATLGILARLQTLPRASPQPCPLLGSWQACLFSSYRLPKATLSILASKAFRPLAASLWPVRSFSAAGRPLAASLWPVRSLPPLFLWASEGNVKHFGPASKASSLSAAGRPLAASLWPVRSLPPLFLWASEGNVIGILDRLQKPLGSRQASCGLSVACPKPASSLLMGFRRQR